MIFEFFSDSNYRNFCATLDDRCIAHTGDFDIRQVSVDDAVIQDWILDEARCLSGECR
jgi:hypothetical protein